MVILGSRKGTFGTGFSINNGGQTRLTESLRASVAREHAVPSCFPAGVVSLRARASLSGASHKGVARWGRPIKLGQGRLNGNTADAYTDVIRSEMNKPGLVSTCTFYEH